MRQTQPSGFSRALKRLLILLICLPIIALLLAVELEPRVHNSTPLTAGELARVEQLLLDATPERPQARGRHALRFSRDELNLLLRFGVGLGSAAGASAADINPAEDQLVARLSIAPLGPDWPVHLNLHSEFDATGEHLRLQRLRLGKLPVPTPILRFLGTAAQTNLMPAQPALRDVQDLLTSLESIAVDPAGVTVNLQWDPELVNRLTQQAQMLFIPEQDRLRIVHYYEQIGMLAAAIPADMRAVSLNTFLLPLFASARERSLAGSDPVAENRTLLQTLAIYVNNEGLSQLVGNEAAAAVPRAKFVEVRLHRRQDLAQHLVSIAAISASAGAGIAEILSTTKEAYDARYRSGFSFSDMTANRVGVLLASYATYDADSARQLQDLMVELSSEHDYMPQVGSNQDGISETEFTALYEDRNSPEYQARLDELEDLISARPLFRELSMP